LAETLNIHTASGPPTTSAGFSRHVHTDGSV
jgi:hypothetical protein